MKRFCCCLLLVCVIGLTACAPHTERDYTLYYPVLDGKTTQGSDFLKTVEFLPDSGFAEKNIEDKARTLLKEQLFGTPPEGCRNPIQGKVEVVYVTLNGNVITVNLAGNYEELTGVKKTLADYSIVMTLTQLPGIRFVRLIPYQKGEEEVLYTAGGALFSDSTSLRQISGQFYYGYGEDELDQEEHVLRLYEEDNLVEEAIYELKLSPDDPRLDIIIPSDFSFSVLSDNGNRCVIELGREAYNEAQKDNRICLSVELTLRSLGYEYVTFQYNGKEVNLRYF